MARKISDIQADLDAAHLSYNDACQEARGASRRETRALNCLNNYQKELDAAVAELRSSAPTGTNWAQQRGLKC